MPPYADHTWSEIQSQPDVWAAALAGLPGRAAAARASLDRRPAYVAVTGCGSTYYLARAAAAAFREVAGLAAAAHPASELWLAPAAALPPAGPGLLVAVSRSGETTETVRAAAGFRAAGRGPVLALTCHPESALAGLADLSLAFPEAQERSIAQTRAFSTLYLACLWLAASWGGRADLAAGLGQLPAAGRAALAAAAPLARRIAADEALARTFVLGSGARYGLACELSLKLKEMALSVSEPFHTLEFRHGPQSMAGPQALILGLRSDDPGGHEAAVLAELRALGATVVEVGVGGDLPVAPVAEAVRGPLYLPLGQLLAYERAVARGLDPDRPHQLAAVVRLAG